MYLRKSSRVTSRWFGSSSSSPSIMMEERRFGSVCSVRSVCSVCSVCSGSFPLLDWLPGTGTSFGRAIVLDGSSVRFGIVVWRFFLSDSRPDRSVRSEQSAQEVNRSIKAVSQSVNQSVRFVGVLPQVRRRSSRSNVSQGQKKKRE